MMSERKLLKYLMGTINIQQVPTGFYLNFTSGINIFPNNDIFTADSVLLLSNQFKTLEIISPQYFAFHLIEVPAK